MATCVNGHVDPPRYENATCKLCAIEKAARFNQANPEKRRIREAKRARIKRREDRLAALAAYGNACACCGESCESFLVMDHIEGDGAAHRRRLQPNVTKRPVGGFSTYRWLRINGYPPGFQVLCANCNMAKERPGGCPHQQQKETPHGNA